MRAKFWTLLFVAILAIFFTFGLPRVSAFDWGQVLFLVILVLLLMVLGIRFRAERRLPILCDPVVLFFAFQAQFFVVGPLGLPLLDLTAFRVTHEGTIAVLCAFLLMLTTFIAGYQLNLGTVIASWLPDFRGGRLKAPGRWYEILILALSVGGCVLYIIDRGGLFEAMRRNYGGKSSSALFLGPFNALMLGTFMMAWRLMVTRSRRLPDLALFCVLLIGEVLFFGFVFGARKQLFFLFFGLFGLWLLYHRAGKAPRYIATILLPPLLVYFSLWGTARQQSIWDLTTGHGDTSRFRQHAFYEGYLSSVSEPFAVACLVHSLFPTTEPYRYGSTLLVTLFGPIPRYYWPDKPIGLGKELTRYTDGVLYTPTAGHSITPTLVGDFYANLGWTGVLLGGMLYGVACRIAASYAAEGMERGGQKNPARVLIGAVFLAGLVEIRSDTATVLAFYFITYPALLFGLTFFDFDYAGESRREPAKSSENEIPGLQGALEGI